MNTSTLPCRIAGRGKLLTTQQFRNRYVSLVLIFAFFVSTASAQLVRSAAGPDVISITAARDQFRLDLGGGTTPDAGFPGRFGGVRREINWDGVPNGFSAPNTLPDNFFNANSPRGVVFSTPGTGFQVSANSGVDATEFGNIDPSYPLIFGTFSPQRLFTALGSTITDVLFFLPGTTTPALTRGFGVVFTDVDVANTTSIELFDMAGNSLGTFFAPAVAGQETFSFLGISYPTPMISRVRITSGNAALAAGMSENIPSSDLVVMDDFIFGEPALLRWYRDFDGDSFGDPGRSTLAASQPTGFVANNLDCNDFRTVYEDNDNDGHGSNIKVPCGFILRNDDCNDNDRTVHSLQAFHRDADGDSYGDAANRIMLCTYTPPAGYVRNSIDCNDNDPGVFWPKSFYRDADGDGLGDPNNKIDVCASTPPAGYVNNKKDTNDTPVMPTTQPVNTSASKMQSRGQGIADNFTLGAYPNPFTKISHIRYTVPVDAKMSIKVFDVLGREVGQVFQGNRSAGTHIAEYRGNKLSSGVYYLRLAATANGKEYVQTQKLIKAE